MNVNPISPSFNSNFTRTVSSQIKDTIADPTDVNNPDAAVGGVVAAGGVSGTAVVASRLKTMRTVMARTQQIGTKVSNLNTRNANILTSFFAKISKYFANTKAMSWASKLMNSPAGKKTIGGVIGLGALGITAAQLYSAGDMAFEAYDNYVG